MEEQAFASLAYQGASALIAIRTVAIWNKNIYVISVTAAALLTTLGTLIHSMCAFCESSRAYR